jgi:intracellular multiplication protein IcmE
MSNDLDNDDLNDAGFDDFDNEKANSKYLGALVQSNPLIKIGIVFAAFALVFAVILLFGGSEETKPPEKSSLSDASEITSIPGSENASPAYLEAIEDVNQQNEERALNEGGSSIPIPVEPPVGRIEQEVASEEQEDPLQKWRRLQEERLKREIDNRELIVTDVGPQDNGQSEAISQMAEIMSAQMQSLLGREDGSALKSQNITPADYIERKEEERLNKLLAQQEAALGSDADGDGVVEEGEIPEIVILPAGKIEYAQMITEANSDIPGPVLAEIASGPLAGSRIIGSFTVENDLMALTFNTVVIDDVAYTIDAIALDPATTLPALATEVDHRYLRRVFIPAAAAFVEGFASAIAESGRTDVTIQGETVASETEEADSDQKVATGVEEAGSELSTIISEMNDDVETLVIVASGTPMGLLFLAPVTRPATLEELN